MTQASGHVIRPVVTVTGPDPNFVDTFVDMWSKTGSSFRPSCSTLDANALSLLGDSRDLVETLLLPGVLTCCYVDLPQRTSLLRKLNLAASIADVVLPLPQRPLPTPTPAEDGGVVSSPTIKKASAAAASRFPQHLVVLVFDHDVRSSCIQINPEGSASASSSSTLIGAGASAGTTEEERQLHNWLVKTESTYDHNTGTVDEDAVRRNEMKMILLSSFLSVKVYRVSHYAGLERANRCIENLALSVPPIEWNTKAKVSRRLSQIRLPTLKDSVDAAQAEWAGSTAKSLLEEEFTLYCENRMHRMNMEMITNLNREVLDRCLKVLEGGVCARDVVRDIEHLAKESLQRVQQSHMKMEEDRATAVRQAEKAAAQSKALAAANANVSVKSWLQHVVPGRYHFWFSKTGLMIIATIVFFIFFSFAGMKSRDGSAALKKK